MERGLSLGVRCCIFRPAFRSSPHGGEMLPAPPTLPGAGARRKGEARVRAAPAHADAPSTPAPMDLSCPLLQQNKQVVSGLQGPGDGWRAFSSSAHSPCPAAPSGGGPVVPGTCAVVVSGEKEPLQPQARPPPHPLWQERRWKSGLWEDPAHWVHCEAGAGGRSGRQAQPRSHSCIRLLSDGGDSSLQGY